jgi:uncharacterized protein involved in exopolysaccharide biosynthesis
MAELQNNQPDSDDEIHLLDYLIVVVKHSRMIIYASVAAMLLTYLVLLILPNKYTSLARLLPPQQNMTMSAQLLNSLGGGGTPGVPSGGGMAGMAAGLLGLKSPSDLYASMMTGYTISDRIIERFELRKLYKEKYIESARKTLGNRTNISSQKDGIITIEVTDKDPKRAAEMANAFAEELDKLLRALAVQEAKSRLQFLDKERVQTTQNLVKAENDLRTFSEQNSVIQIDTQTRGILEYIARLRAEIDAKEVQIQVMRQQATRYNYDVVRLETEAQGLKSKLKNAESQYDQNCVGDTCLNTSKVPTLGLEYLRLYREVKFQEGLSQLYTKLVEMARLDMVKDFSIVQIVDRALPPEKRSNSRLLPAVLAGIGTCFLMLFVAFGREYWQNAKAREENSQRLSLLRAYLEQWHHPFRRL